MLTIICYYTLNLYKKPEKSNLLNNIMACACCGVQFFEMTDEMGGVVIYGVASDTIFGTELTTVPANEDLEEKIPFIMEKLNENNLGKKCVLIFDPRKKIMHTR